MGTKKEELEKALAGEGCLGKAVDDEPIFVLLAQDRCAPWIVMEWVQEAKRRGVPGPKVSEALDLARRMLDWQGQHGSKVPD